MSTDAHYGYPHKVHEVLAQRADEPAENLPPLPLPDCGTVQVGREEISCGHSDDAMRAYGQACAAAAIAKPTPCIGNDPTCPCQDGDACHYKDTPTTKGWPVPAQQTDAPVAWMWTHDETGRVGFVDQWQLDNGWREQNPRLHVTTPLYPAAPAAPAPQRADEPVAWIKDTSLIALRRDETTVLAYPHEYLIRPAVPLYIAAPAALAYVPLSDEEMRNIFRETQPGNYPQTVLMYWPGLKELCRAIESLVVARMKGEGK